MATNPQRVPNQPNSPTRELFYPTAQKSSVLEHVARHELLTINDLVYLIYGDLSGNDLDVAQASLRRTVRTLKREKYLQSRYFRPEGFKGKGKYPHAFWLLDKGVEWAKEHYPATDPKAHGVERSDNNILHDLQRVDTRIAIYEFAKKKGLQIGWRKNDLNHVIKPDDLFELTKTKTAHFFLEEERHKKSLEEIYDKLAPYIRVRGSQSFQAQWGFPYFTVIMPLRSTAAVENTLVHLKGGCNCLDPNARRLHAKPAYKIISEHIWFTTHEAMVTKTAGPIFFTTSDNRPRSFLDLIR